MAKTRRKFDKQFKVMVVELSKTREDYTKLAEELDISLSSSIDGTGNFLKRKKHLRAMESLG
jgi:hypothetical protein